MNTMLTYEAQKAIIEERLRNAERAQLARAARRPVKPRHPTRSRLALLAASLLIALAVLGLAGVPSAGALTAVPAQIVVKFSSTSPAVGQDITITAIAKDSSGHTFTSWSAPATWSDTSGALSPAAPSAFVNGVSTTVAHVGVPFHHDVITITSVITAKSPTFNIVGPLDHLSLSVPSSDRVDTPFAVQATARDAAGNLVTSYTGSATWTDRAGALAAFAPSDFVAGTSTTSVQSSTPLRGDHVTISSGGLSANSAAFNVVGPATHLNLSAPSSVPASTPFAITARALDAAGNVAVGYNAPASWSESSGTIMPSAPSDFVAGVSTTTVQVPVAVRSDSVTLASGGLSANRTFNVVGPFDHVAVSWTPSSPPAYGCTSATGSVIAQAEDVAGNVITSYNDTADYWLLQSGQAPDTISPAAPAPFVAGVSTNPNVTVTATGLSSLTLWVVTGGKVGIVNVCG
jgi:hypothetical protein